MLMAPTEVPRISLNGHWDFVRDMDPKKYVGFLYVILDPYIKVAYLGMKFYKRGADWKTYVSSAGVLKEQMVSSKAAWEFIVLDEYKTAGGLRFAETYLLCSLKAPLSSTWLNKRVEGITWKVNEDVSELTQRRLCEITKRL